MGENAPKKIKLLITIVDRGKGEKLAELYRKNKIMYNIILLGDGTAKSEILDYLGLGRTEKDIVLSVVHENNVQNIFKELNEKMHLDKPGNGVAFTIPVSSVDSILTLDFINNLIEDRRE